MVELKIEGSDNVSARLSAERVRYLSILRILYYDRKLLCGNEGSRIHNFYYAEMKDLELLTF